MKKTLLASAALMACAAAFAQSSVTLYGLADVGIGKAEGAKTNMISGTALNNSTSFVGLRGAENLGGGLQAGFNFEQAINLEDGSWADNSPVAWQHAANLWVGGNWGRLQLGRATTPSYNAMKAWDLMGLPNYAPAIGLFGYVGGNAGARNDSLISYKTPAMGGFTAEIGYLIKGHPQVANSNEKIDLGLTYANGPMTAGLAYNKRKGSKASYGLGMKYDFGSFTLGASYQDSRNWIFPYVVPVLGRSTGVTLGGAARFGPFGVSLDIARQLKRESEFQGMTYKEKKYTNGAVELKYALSKRTFLYGVYLRQYDLNHYGLGVQHGF